MQSWPSLCSFPSAKWRDAFEYTRGYKVRSNLRWRTQRKLFFGTQLTVSMKRPSNDSAPFFNAMILFGSSQGSFCIPLLASEVDEQEPLVLSKEGFD